jgi:hypothetical protein
MHGIYYSDAHFMTGQKLQFCLFGYWPALYAGVTVYYRHKSCFISNGRHEVIKRFHDMVIDETCRTTGILLDLIYYHKDYRDSHSGFDKEELTDIV